ncbi:MAG: hypothetical protein Q8O53_03605 [Candidatus Moranbacteria bacterium]|nr:hypothetical protein [Candidatus Moranbacteria bacterium]
MKVVTLSTLVDRAYTAGGEEILGFEPGKFQSSAAYRREFTLAHGTSLVEMRPIPDMVQAFSGWNVYTTKTEAIATPLAPEQVKYLSGINSQYHYWDKVKGTARGAVSLDYVGTAIGIGFDLINAAGAKSQGFDYQSMMGRAQQGYNLSVLERLRAQGEQSCLAAKLAERRKQ